MINLSTNYVKIVLKKNYNKIYMVIYKALSFDVMWYQFTLLIFTASSPSQQPCLASSVGRSPVQARTGRKHSSL